MHVISKKMIDKFVQEHPESKSSLNAWYRIVSRMEWFQFADIRATYSHAEKVGRFVVFDVGGNNYRLIADIHYAREGARGTVYLRHVLTHGEYDRDRWKSG